MAKLGWTLGALAGSLVGGAAISAMMVAGERKSGKPSELIVLKRRAAQKAGARTLPPSAPFLPTATEQVETQGGHMLLSAVGGVAYAAAFDEDAPVLLSGVGFGAAFYALSHGVLKPVLSTSSPEWEEEPATIGRHLTVHAVFGLLIAAGAKLGSAWEDELRG